MKKGKWKYLYTKYSNAPVQLKAAFWFTICNVLQKGISVIAVPIYTRILSAQQYGSYSVILSWLEIFDVVATFRIAYGGYAVGLTRYEDDRDAYTSSLQSLSIFVTTTFLVCYLFFADIINAQTKMDTATTLTIFVILYAMPAIQFWTVRKRVEYQYISILVVTMTSSLFCVLFGTLSAFLCERKDIAIVIARACVQGCVALFIIIAAYRRKPVVFRAQYWKRTLRFNIPLLPHYLSTVLLHSSDKIIIEKLAGEAQSGIYGVAYTASMCMQLFSTSVNQALQPWFFQKIKENKLADVHKIVNSILVLVAGLNLLLIALAPEVVRLLAPAEYREAVWVIPPLTCSVVVMFAYQYFVNVEFYFEESRLTAAASIGAALLNIVLNYKLIPVFGYMAAGYTTLISYSVFGIAHYFFMCLVCRKHGIYGRVFNIRRMLAILLLFFAAAAILTTGYAIPLVRYLFILISMLAMVSQRQKLLQIFRELQG